MRSAPRSRRCRRRARRSHSSSDGGSLVAGIRIGTLIREKKFTTIIPDGASCASACALAWLGGTRRFMGEGASVGFHAAYVLKSYGPVESSSGNAILGAYLNQLGLSEDAILYITKTAPTSIQWMSLEDADEYGIVVAPLSPQQATRIQRGGDRGVPRRQRPSAAPPISCAGCWRIGRSRAPKACRARAACMRRRWSTTASRRRGRRSCAASTVLRTAGPSASTPSVRVRCRRPAPRPATTCRVKGVMSFKHLRRQDLERRSRGIASFEYRVALAGEAPQVIAESTHRAGAVVVGGLPLQASAAGPPASCSPRSPSSFRSASPTRLVRAAQGLA